MSSVLNSCLKISSASNQTKVVSHNNKQSVHNHTSIEGVIFLDTYKLKQQQETQTNNQNDIPKNEIVEIKESYSQNQNVYSIKVTNPKNEMSKNKGSNYQNENAEIEFDLAEKIRRDMVSGYMKMLNQ